MSVLEYPLTVEHTIVTLQLQIAPTQLAASNVHAGSDQLQMDNLVHVRLSYIGASYTMRKRLAILVAILWISYKTLLLTCS